MGWHYVYFHSLALSLSSQDLFTVANRMNDDEVWNRAIELKHTKCVEMEGYYQKHDYWNVLYILAVVSTRTGAIDVASAGASLDTSAAIEGAYIFISLGRRFPPVHPPSAP